MITKRIRNLALFCADIRATRRVLIGPFYLTVSRRFASRTEVTIVTWRARTRDRFRLLVKQTARASRPGCACTNSLGASAHRSPHAARHSTHPSSSRAALLVPILGPVCPEFGGELWASWTPRKVSSNKVIPSAGGDANSCTKLKKKQYVAKV